MKMQWEIRVLSSGLYEDKLMFEFLATQAPDGDSSSNARVPDYYGPTLYARYLFALRSVHSKVYSH